MHSTLFAFRIRFPGVQKNTRPEKKGNLNMCNETQLYKEMHIQREGWKIFSDIEASNKFWKKTKENVDSQFPNSQIHQLIFFV